MTIYFYSKTDEFGFLSNFAAYGFREGGRYWKTVEHYFQAKKFADEGYAAKICDAATPKEARELGQTRKMKIRDDWDEVRIEIMRHALEMKFRANPEIKDKLIRTDGEELKENSPFDFFWGIGKTGEGENRLGRLLMDLRSELKQL